MGWASAGVGFVSQRGHWVTWGGVHSAVSDAGKVWDFPRLYNEGDHLKGLSLVLQHEEDENNSHTGK